MTEHTCIKPSCDNRYKDADPDAYYCPDCASANKELAQQIDAQVASRPVRSQKSDLQIAKEHGQVKTSPDGTEALFIKA